MRKCRQIEELYKSAQSWSRHYIAALTDQHSNKAFYSFNSLEKSINFYIPVSVISFIPLIRKTAFDLKYQQRFNITVLAITMIYFANKCL